MFDKKLSLANLERYLKAENLEDPISAINFFEEYLESRTLPRSQISDDRLIKNSEVPKYRSLFFDAFKTAIEYAKNLYTKGSKVKISSDVIKFLRNNNDNINYRVLIVDTPSPAQYEISCLIDEYKYLKNAEIARNFFTTAYLVMAGMEMVEKCTKRQNETPILQGLDYNEMVERLKQDSSIIDPLSVARLINSEIYARTSITQSGTQQIAVEEISNYRKVFLDMFYLAKNRIKNITKKDKLSLDTKVIDKWHNADFNFINVEPKIDSETMHNIDLIMDKQRLKYPMLGRIFCALSYYSMLGFDAFKNVFEDTKNGKTLSM